MTYLSLQMTSFGLILTQTVNKYIQLELKSVHLLKTQEIGCDLYPRPSMVSFLRIILLNRD